MKTDERLVSPAHPERICWGCSKYCPADDLGCANGTVRTPHPSELFGEDWREWEEERRRDSVLCGGADNRDDSAGGGGDTR